MECPGHLAGEAYPPSHVHCQCANTLEGSNILPNSQCDSNIGPASTHCVGPYTAGGTMLGSHGTGSIYEVPRTQPLFSVTSGACETSLEGLCVSSPNYPSSYSDG